MSLCMNEKTAFLGLISLPQCTIEQVLDLRENPRLDDSPSPTPQSQQRGTICLSVLIDHLTFLGKPDWLGFFKQDHQRWRYSTVERFEEKELNKDKRKEQRNNYILIWGGSSSISIFYVYIRAFGAEVCRIYC